MTDELITDLGQISALRVISRTSIMQYKGAREPLPQIARELNVDAVVEGTVLRAGQKVRITAQFISLLWKVELLMVPFPQELKSRNEISGNISRTPEFLITVGVSVAVDLFVNQLCHSHLQTRFPT